MGRGEVLCKNRLPGRCEALGISRAVARGCETLRVGAPVEGVHSDLGETVWQGDLGQPGTPLEGLVSDPSGQSVGRCRWPSRSCARRYVHRDAWFRSFIRTSTL